MVIDGSVRGVSIEVVGTTGGPEVPALPVHVCVRAFWEPLVRVFQKLKASEIERLLVSSATMPKSPLVLIRLLRANWPLAPFPVSRV